MKKKEVLIDGYSGFGICYNRFVKETRGSMG
jgi:hypothetical protein